MQMRLACLHYHQQASRLVCAKRDCYSRTILGSIFLADPFRNLKLRWHRLMNTQIITLDGIRVHCGDTVPRAVRNGLFKNTYEDGEREMLKRCVRAGDKVLEIGGGIGFVGMAAAKIAGAGNVISYEANPRQKEVIEANYALNSPVPELRMKAVTSDGEPVTFHQSDNVISSSIYQRDEAQTAITVPSDALRDVLAEMRPDVVVMDVEGAEIELLADIDLSAVRAMVVELHPHIVGEEKIAALLASLTAAGFEVSGDMRKNVLLTQAGAA